jgi:hypothetical protein
MLVERTVSVLRVNSVTLPSTEQLLRYLSFSCRVDTFATLLPLVVWAGMAATTRMLYTDIQPESFVLLPRVCASAAGHDSGRQLKIRDRAPMCVILAQHIAAFVGQKYRWACVISVGYTVCRC